MQSILCTLIYKKYTTKHIYRYKKYYTLMPWLLMCFPHIKARSVHHIAYLMNDADCHFSTTLTI